MQRETIAGPPCLRCGERELRVVADQGGGLFVCALCGVACLLDSRSWLERCLARTPRWLPPEQDR